LWWKFSLELGCEDIGVTTSLCLVNWALVDTLVFLCVMVTNHGGTAVYDWDNTEQLLWSTLFKLADSWLPTCSFNLETEHVSSFLYWWKIWLPVELLQYICLDGEFVKLLLLFSSINLLDCGQEGLWVE